MSVFLFVEHVSWRHQNDGSWFIQALTKVFDEYAALKDVVSMLIKVYFCHFCHTC